MSHQRWTPERKKAWNKLKWKVTILSGYTIRARLHRYQDGVLLFLTVNTLTPRWIYKAGQGTTACPFMDPSLISK